MHCDMQIKRDAKYIAKESEHCYNRMCNVFVDENSGNFHTLIGSLIWKSIWQRI